jgi:hypothetical protein
MDRPQSAQEWAAWYSQRARTEAAQRNREERAAAKQGPPAFDIHPMIFSRHNTFHHVREAERVVAETQQRWKAERERLASPHPMTQAPFVQAILDEAIANMRKRT